MQPFASRAGRWPLALTFTALAALGACADEPVAPRTLPALTANATQDFDHIIVITSASGGTEFGSLQHAVTGASDLGATIYIDPSLEGDTITLDAPLYVTHPVSIVGPAKGITISGNDKHQVIDSRTAMWLKNVTLTKGNADSGSAISTPSLYMENTTVQDNRGPGAAIRVIGTLSMVNSTVSRNVVGAPAVQYGPSASVLIDNSTIAYNAPAPGLGVYGLATYKLRVTLRNAILSNNGSPQQNCSNYFGLVYEGTNISNDWSCADAAITPSDPQLLPLAYNGGPNMTHAIPHTSPAYNKGTVCSQTMDQRYVTRDAKCDVGAFEFNDWTKVNIAIDPNTKVDATGRALLTGTIKCTHDDTFNLQLMLQQEQKVGRTQTEVHAHETVPMACTTTTKAWSATMVLTDGAFQAGAAKAGAQTLGTPEWATPASVTSAVKISVTRK